MKKILIIGATSDIAEQCSRLWAARGDQMFLVGRNQNRLDIIKSDLLARGASQVYSYAIDINDFSMHPAMLDQAELYLAGFDTVLIAHGTLPNQKNCEKSFEATFQEIKTNALSTISLLTLIANRFEEKNTGTIAVISSVAGERGRASNYVYGSAKGMLTTFTSGLRQRLSKSKIRVVTIKPGFVDTRMTAEFNKGILWISPHRAASQIVKFVDYKNSDVYVPSFWRIIMLVIKLIPNRIFNRLDF